MERKPKKPENVLRAQRRGDHEALSALGRKGAEVKAVNADVRQTFADIEAERRAQQPIPRDIVNEDGNVIPNPAFYEQVDEVN